MLSEIYTLLTQRGDFFFDLLVEHLWISLIAIVIAMIIGGAFGIFISEYKKCANITIGTVNILYTIPSISMLGFLIPFSGIGNATAIIALTIYALLPMVRSTYTGISNVDPNVIEAAKGMGSTRAQILFKIKIPLAMPVIVLGVKNMVTMTVSLAGIASFIGAGGLGVAIYRGIAINDPAMTVVGSLLIALLALILDFVLGWIGKKVRVGTREGKKSYKLVGAVAAVLCAFFIFGIVMTTQNADTINVATKNVSEQYIMGEILDIMIEQETDLNVDVTFGVGGGTSNIQPGMESGGFDVYPEYTGTAWSVALQREGIVTEEMFEELKTITQDELNQTWVGMYGFNNTYGIAVTKEAADKYNLKTFSDLAKVSDELIFGAEYEFFERLDGYVGLTDAYGMNFKSTKDVDIGLKYDALSQRRVDAAIIYTTDGQLTNPDYVLLEDDKEFYPTYICGHLIRTETLEEYPELNDVFAKLEGLINEEEMSTMNYEVETNGKEPRDVANDFLASKGLIK